ncbi:MAG: hypothetical protein DSY46_02460 [Hydrogenimonas sp.]|nr:MAG: hypothetical protein DSY46_02460 [Hydrogenimonas sp.]
MNPINKQLRHLRPLLCTLPGIAVITTSTADGGMGIGVMLTLLGMVAGIITHEDTLPHFSKVAEKIF